MNHDNDTSTDGLLEVITREEWIIRLSVIVSASVRGSNSQAFDKSLQKFFAYTSHGIEENWLRKAFICRSGI